MAAASALVDGDASEAEAEVAPCVGWPRAVAERYERLNKLGDGFFGDVYKAWDRVDQRFVAVKRLAGRTDADFVKTGLREFAREVMSLAACRGHPSVVQLLATYADSSRGDGDCFLVTEYAGPVNLREYMALRCREGRPFDEAEVRDAMRQLLAGVKRAHDAGVLHRDVEPENVLVDERTVDDDVVVVVGRNGKEEQRQPRRVVTYKICGFGMSEPAAQKEKDGSSALASSSPYRAPEIFLGSKDYDGRIDTWGLGCIMADLLVGTGEPFFGDEEVFPRMLYTVGSRGIVKWPGLQRLAAPDLAAKLRKEHRRDKGHLREMFPLEVLSRAGFNVLKGLLHSSPERRLTAAAALKKRWFKRHSFGGCCFMPCAGGVSP